MYCLCEGRQWFQYIGYDNTAYMDYIDLDVRCPRKAIKHYQSINQSIIN